MWTEAPNCYLDMLDKSQQQVCGAVGRALAGIIESVPQRQNVTNLTLFCRYNWKVFI